jgi:DNA adenine methylase
MWKSCGPSPSTSRIVDDVSVPEGQRYPSPLRYPGGKGKVANYIKLLLLENDLVGCEYVEPYAGGASVALSLLFEEYADHIHINDLNRSVHAFWKVVLERSVDLCDLVASVNVTTEEWHRQRAIQAEDDPDEFDLAFSTFFLNRTSRSGIIGGGIIGGLDQTGQWKIDARFNRNDLIRRIRKIARYRNRITVTCLDAAEYVTKVLPGISSPFIYLDPPYYVKGEGLYQNFYRDSDHKQIKALVSELRAPWVVSYDSAPVIAELYEAFPSIGYDLNYSAQRRHRGAELMFFGPGLVLPDVSSPANVPFSVVDDFRITLT